MTSAHSYVSKFCCNCDSKWMQNDVKIFSITLSCKFYTIVHYFQIYKIDGSHIHGIFLVIFLWLTSFIYTAYELLIYANLFLIGHSVTPTEIWPLDLRLCMSLNHRAMLASTNKINPTIFSSFKLKCSQLLII